MNSKSNYDYCSDFKITYEQVFYYFCLFVAQNIYDENFSTTTDFIDY